ncbi:mitochondrial 54S ribosomal protein bL27m [Ascoidea rubescens DSM 1968]|uniref:Large ribosomal subunit protein bL27m n=1 Tax=Ascoidea rubescens DSM 1968 TaxID=1344418 RepID=A0A1D2VQT9_9ASCO|nr:mitochondrial ribosomal protein of the large subunit [Ascoidea rubescens DSM 1968]ODV63974.1 mitochondrial ribosomal protein of the large subunit [Ascoidea rubescens DSM 1968]
MSVFNKTFSADMLSLLYNATGALDSLQFVRTSTKKAGGGKTNNFNSAGRRLGPKKHEGQLVQTGEIIMRQRGSKFYPGENVGIGKDYTIFALEPGFVRFYLDPFHPKRKFIGVALREDLRLPTPHWEPRVRRFGYQLLTDPIEAEKEERNMSRKEYLDSSRIFDQLQNRQLKNEQLKKLYAEQLSLITSESFSESDLDLITDRLVLLSRYCKNGQALEDASGLITFNHIYDLKLAVKRGELTQEDFQTKKENYEKLSNIIDPLVDFDSKFMLYKKLSKEEKDSSKENIISQLDSLVKNPIINLDTKKKILQLINQPFYSRKEIVQLRRKYLKPVLPETLAIANKPGKKTIVIKRWNDEKRRVDTVIRTKDAFLSRLN